MTTTLFREIAIRELNFAFRRFGEEFEALVEEVMTARV